MALNKWLLIGLAAAALVLAVLTWRGLASSSDAPTTAPSRKSTSEGSPAPAASSSTSTRPELAAKPSPGPGPQGEQVEEEEEDPAAALARFTDVVVPRELYAVVLDCYDGQPVTGGEQKMEVGYRLVVADGLASISGARNIESGLGDRELEDCIVGKLEGHSWQVASGFELDEQSTADIAMSGLRKLSKRKDDGGD